MAEKLQNSRDYGHETEKMGNYPEAITHALDGFAPNGESWEAAHSAFMETMEEGRSLNEALTAATGAAGEAAKRDGLELERHPTEAEVAFWDNMDPTREHSDDEPTPAIERALNGFAPDGDRWVTARDTFNHYIEMGAPVGYALENALFRAELSEEGPETHLEVARDRFYAGMDPDYAPADHFKGSPYGARVSLGDKKYEVKLGPSAQTLRRRRLNKLANAAVKDRNAS